MEYLEIAIKTTSAACDIVADILQTRTNEGVNIIDKNDINIPSWDYVEEGLLEKYSDDCIVKGYVNINQKNEILALVYQDLQLLKSNMSDILLLEMSFSIVNDTDWLNVWKKYYKPIKIKNIVICPIWEDYQTNSREKCVKIDPGLAFGTGEHATTKMIIQLMQTIKVQNKSVIDVGCGSGILSLCASALGANDVLLIDFDIQAIESSQSNIRLNSFASNCKVVCGNLVDNVKQKFDIVLANLTADILAKLVENIGNCVVKGGFIILSGILATRLEEVEQVYNAKGFTIITKLIDGEWASLLCQVQ